MSKPNASGIRYLLRSFAIVRGKAYRIAQARSSLRPRLDLEYLVRDLREVSAAPTRAFEEREEYHPRPRHEGGGAPRSHGSRHVPGVGRDEPDLPDLYTEALCGHVVRLGRRFQALYGVSGENLLQVAVETRVFELGVGYLLRRVRYSLDR